MIGMFLPKITCVVMDCECFEESISAYSLQDYPNKELIVIFRGDSQDAEAFLAQNERTDILFFSAPPDLSNVDLHSLSFELATGQLICDWNNGDYKSNWLTDEWNKIRTKSEANLVFTFKDV